MDYLYLDAETIPVQDPAAKDEIFEPFLASACAERLTLEQEFSGLRAPANLKDPAKIDAWEANERPRKEAAIRERMDGLDAAARWKGEQAWRRTSFDGAMGQIVAISWAVNDAKPQIVHAGSVWSQLASEAVVLRAFFGALEAIPQAKQRGLVWVGHWIADFDLRFIFQRSVIHGVRPPSFIPFHEPAWSDRIFDTMVKWSGSKGKVTLDKLCRVLGISGKGLELGGDDIDGSKVWDFVRDGKIEQVAAYCQGDVERVREVHQRMTFGGGR